jgi:hydroxymethylpyrimidine pyrophosphatase-like HAD family hydrolase
LAIEQGLAGQFGARVYSCSVFSPVYHCQVIDVFARHATKWTGIEALCRRLGVDAGRAVAIGDDLNDLPMLRGAQLSFAMGNGSAVVKQAAKRTTLAQSEAGVAHVIDGILGGEF